MKKITMQRGSIAIILLIAIAVFTVTAVGINEYRSAHEALKEQKAAAQAKDLLARVEIALEAVQGLQKEQDALGATNKIPDLRALYEDSLATKITSSATSFTLTRGTSAGTALASSTYPFIIDEGTSNEEFVLADCTGTTCTNVTRGLSLTTGTTTVAALQKAHGRGASVKITDGPILLILNRILQGVDTFPNLLSYQSGTGCSVSSPNGAICDKLFITTQVNQGAATSTETLGGIVELATKLEQASSTDLGANQPLVLQAKYATSSPSGTAAGLFALILNNAGKIAQAALDLTASFTWSGLHTFTGGLTVSNSNTTLATTTVLGVTVHPTFGGTGADGALSISSATTTIDLGSAAYVEKNYSSISITGTAALAFSNPASGGTIVVIKSQGDVTLTSATSTMIYLGGVGGVAGTGGSGSATCSSRAGGGGASASTSGGSGSDGAGNGVSGTNGTGYGINQFGGTAQTGGVGGTTANGTGGITPGFNSLFAGLYKMYVLPGSGGGGASGCTGDDGGPGGRGAGALYMEVGGSLNRTGTIYAAGADAQTGTNAGGGGGGAGSVVIIYNSLVANSGTITVTGGAGSTDSNHGTGGNGGAGYSIVTKNTNF